MTTMAASPKDGLLDYLKGIPRLPKPLVLWGFQDHLLEYQTEVSRICDNVSIAFYNKMSYIDRVLRRVTNDITENVTVITSNPPIDNIHSLASVGAAFQIYNDFLNNVKNKVDQYNLRVSTVWIDQESFKINSATSDKDRSAIEAINNTLFRAAKDKFPDANVIQHARGVGSYFSGQEDHDGFRVLPIYSLANIEWCLERLEGPFVPPGARTDFQYNVPVITLGGQDYRTYYNKLWKGEYGRWRSVSQPYNILYYWGYHLRNYNSPFICCWPEPGQPNEVTGDKEQWYYDFCAYACGMLGREEPWIIEV